MPTVVTGHQPGYLPWLGLFHKISLADIFIYMDDVQYLTQDWNNRNRIKTPLGPRWLTVPVSLKMSPSRKLRDIVIDNSRAGTSDDWQRIHWRTIELNYKRAPWFARYADWLRDMYLGRRWERLVEIDEYQLRFFLGELGLSPTWHRASELNFTQTKSNLVLEHCQRFQAGICVTGSQGRRYIDHAAFAAAGIRVYHQEYRSQPYTQVWGDFIHALSVLDVLLNCGPDTRSVVLGGNLTRAALESREL